MLLDYFTAFLNNVIGFKDVSKNFISFAVFRKEVYDFNYNL